MNKQIEKQILNPSTIEMIHELRNPLCSSMGCILFLKEYLKRIESFTLFKMSEKEIEYISCVQEKVKNSIEIIEKSNKRIKKFIDNITVN